MNMQAPSSETMEHSFNNTRPIMTMKAVGSHETLQMLPTKHGLL
jgi:hypothetical protein